MPRAFNRVNTVPKNLGRVIILVDPCKSFSLANYLEGKPVGGTQSFAFSAS